jgi:hypothetical protein
VAEDLRFAGQPDRETGAELGAERAHEQLRGAIELVVLTLGVNDEALRSVAHRRHRGGSFGRWVLTVRERPRADGRAGGAHFAHQRR